MKHSSESESQLLYYEEGFFQYFDWGKYFIDLLFGALLGATGTGSMAGGSEGGLVKLKITKDKLEAIFPTRTITAWSGEIKDWIVSTSKPKKCEMVDFGSNSSLQINIKNKKPIFIKSDKIGEIEKALRELTNT